MAASLVAGLAGLVAETMSMAAGEYVSRPLAADTDNTDLARARIEFSADPAREQKELLAFSAVLPGIAQLADPDVRLPVPCSISA